MAFFSREITTLEQMRTKVAARPIPTPLMVELVTASAGQVPSTSTSTGFSLMMPFTRIFSLFILYAPFEAL